MIMRLTYFMLNLLFSYVGLLLFLASIINNTVLYKYFIFISNTLIFRALINIKILRIFVYIPF